MEKIILEIKDKPYLKVLIVLCLVITMFSFLVQDVFSDVDYTNYKSYTKLIEAMVEPAYKIIVTKDSSSTDTTNAYRFKSNVTYTISDNKIYFSSSGSMAQFRKNNLDPTWSSGYSNVTYYSSSIIYTNFDLLDNEGNIIHYADIEPVDYKLYNNKTIKVSTSNIPSVEIPQFKMLYNNSTISGLVVIKDKNLNIVKIYNINGAIDGSQINITLPKTNETYYISYSDIDNNNTYYLFVDTLTDTNKYKFESVGNQYILGKNAEIDILTVTNPYFKVSSTINFWYYYNENGKQVQSYHVLSTNETFNLKTQSGTKIMIMDIGNGNDTVRLETNCVLSSSTENKIIGGIIDDETEVIFPGTSGLTDLEEDEIMINNQVFKEFTCTNSNYIKISPVYKKLINKNRYVCDLPVIYKTFTLSSKIEILNYYDDNLINIVNMNGIQNNKFKYVISENMYDIVVKPINGTCKVYIPKSMLSTDGELVDGVTHNLVQVTTIVDAAEQEFIQSEVEEHKTSGGTETLAEEDYNYAQELEDDFSNYNDYTSFGGNNSIELDGNLIDNIKDTSQNIQPFIEIIRTNFPELAFIVGLLITFGIALFIFNR